MASKSWNAVKLNNLQEHDGFRALYHERREVRFRRGYTLETR